MNHVRDHFLADTALAGDQHICFRRRHRVDQFLDLLHRLAFEHRRKARLGQLQSLLEFLGFLTQRLCLFEERLFLQGLFDQTEQFFRRVRLADEMIRAALNWFDRVRERVVRGQDDHLRFGSLGFDLIQHLQALDIRQLQIEENERRTFIFQRL